MEITDILTFEERFIDPSAPTGLWFCESIIEAQAVTVNAVSLGIGCTYEGLENFTEWFEQFPFLFICMSDRRNRQDAEKELRVRLPNMPIYVVVDAAFQGQKSISSYRKSYGMDSIPNLLNGSVELPPIGLLNISDVTPIDTTRIKRTLSGIFELDRATGGFLYGDATVWTGKRGEGKSTALNQVIVNSISQVPSSGYYSGELRADRLKNWLSLQAAGPDNLIEHKPDASGRVWYSPTQEADKAINEWWNKRIFLYDTKIVSAHDEDRILSVFEYAVKRYGTKVFAIDNLMTTNYKRMSDADYYRAQSRFVKRCKNFAEAHNVHVHIVAHPKKTEGVTDGDDISGSGDIANIADNVIAVQRFKENDSRGDTGLTVMKARWTGETVKIGLKFEPKSKRFYATNGGNPNWKYGWEQSKYEEIEVPVPFA